MADAANGATQAGENGDSATRAVQSWKLVLAYDGTDFRGWQVQPGLRTVQGELARAVFEVTGERTLPQGSGRTDTGVHAEGQAVSVVLAAPIPPERLLAALNRRLPAAVRVLSAELRPNFHGRSNVRSKTYEYRIFPRRGLVREVGVESSRDAQEFLLDCILPPWRARFMWDCPVPLRLGAMQAAATTVVGTHDFSSFAAHDPDRSARLAGRDGAVSNVRTVFTSACIRQGDLICCQVTGNGFLHHMVRNLVGTLVEVGSGRRPVEWVAEVLAARDRRLAGPTAPPQGLFLMQVDYGEAPPRSQGPSSQQTVTK